MSVESYRNKVDKAARQYAVAASHVRDEKLTLSIAEAQLEAEMEALRVAQGLAEGMQQRAHLHIARVVSRCLTLVFEEPYELQIKFEARRGKTDASLVFVRNGLVLDDPVNEVGIGVIDVAAFGLRLANLMFSLPQRRRVIIMDEPFKHISSSRRGGRVAAMLEVLAKEFDMQFIMITHLPELVTGTVVEME